MLSACQTLFSPKPNLQVEDGLAVDARRPTLEEAQQADINPEEAGKTVGVAKGQKMAKVKSEIFSGLGRMMSFHVVPFRRL